MSGSPARLFLSSVMLPAAVLAYVLSLGRLRRYERAQAMGPGWWFGYARDGVNLGGGLLFFAAFVVVGFSGPVALFVAAAMGLLVYLCDALFGLRWSMRAAPLISFALCLSVCLSLLVWRAPLGRGLRALLAHIAAR